MGTNRHGRYATSDPHYATADAATTLAAVLDPFPTNGWVDEIVVHLGKNTGIAGTPTVQFSVYDTDAGAPDDRVANGARFTPGATMNDGTGGDDYASAITWTGGGSGSPSQSYLRARSGVVYAIDVNVQGTGRVTLGMLAAASSSNTNKNFYRQLAAPSSPPDAFDLDQTQSNEGQLTYSLSYTPNRTPTATFDGPGATINTATPNIEGSFTDLDTTFGDRMNMYQIQVRNKATGALVWSPSEFDTTTTEKTNAAFTRAYAGTALTPGTTYQARIRVADAYDTWSAWTEWTGGEFLYSTGPSVTMTGPTGKQTNLTTQTFSADYRHETMLAGEEVRVRIKRNGSAWYESSALTKAIAAPGGPTTPVAFTVTQASLSPALPTLLDGSTYTVEIQAKDSADVWSAYSAPITFTSNARPLTPSGLSPSDGAIVTTIPQITFFGTDADDVPPALDGYVRIKNIPNVDNPSMETVIGNWAHVSSTANMTSTVTRESTLSSDSIGGSGKDAITPNTAASGATSIVRNSVAIPVDANGVYAVTMDVRTTNTAIVPRIRIYWYTSGMADISNDTEAAWTPTADAWTEHTLQATAPATAAFMRIAITAITTAGSATGSIYWDHVRYMRIAEATWNGTLGRFEYTPSATDWAEFGDYDVDAYTTDGFLTSGYSAESTVTYADGPEISFVNPVDESTVLTTRTRIMWQIDSGDQAQYKVEYRTASEGHGDEPTAGWNTHVYSTDWIADTDAFEYPTPADVLDNETWNQVIVHVKNALGIEATITSDFYVEFPPVRQLTGFSVVVAQGRFDAANQGSQALISWDQTDYPPSQFGEYRVTKRLASQTPGQAVVIFRSSSPSDTRFVDDNIRGRQQYVYALTQEVTRDGDDARSERVEASAEVTFRSLIINDAIYSGDFRVVIRHWTEVRAGNSIAGTEKIAWGASKPTVAFGSQDYDIPTIVAQFIDDDYGTVMDYYNALNELRGRKQPVFVRHPVGIAWFCTIKSVEWDLTSSGMFVATINLVQNNYTEGTIL